MKFNWFRKKEVIEQKEEPIWELGIFFNTEYPKYPQLIYSNKNIRPLMKPYLWFLQRKSELYNIRHSEGQTCIRRKYIVAMSLRKKEGEKII